MKKMSILAIAAAALMSCGNSYEAKQVNMAGTNDSVNYALGLLNGQQIRMQYLRDLEEKDVDAATSEFIDALQRGWDGKVEEKSEAQTIAQNIANAVKGFEKDGLAGNEAWTLNEKVMLQALVNGLYCDTTVMTADAARNYFQTKYQESRMAEGEAEHGKAVTAKCPAKVKTISLKNEEDSLNYAFGMLNGDEIGRYVLSMDSDGTQHKEFIEAVNKALKSGIQYPQLVNMGEQVGQTIKQQSEEGLIGEPSLTTDFELIKQGFVNGLKDFGEWTMQEAGEYIQTTMDHIKYGNVKEEGEAFLEANKLKDGIITTESGLQYEVLQEGKGAKPSATDRVKVHYHGTLIDGTVFDSSVERGEPIVFGLNQVIAGWTEGVQLMSVGSKYKFYIPQQLGYGSRAAGQIPPYSTLIFEVELLGIEK